MGEQELLVTLESLRGQLKRLETVVRMGSGEQRRINTDAFEAIRSWNSDHRCLEKRLDRLEKRQAAYAGAMAALWVLFQIVQSIWR